MELIKTPEMAITRKRMARKRSLLLAARGDLQEVPGETHNQESEKKCRPQPSTLTLTLFISNITVTIVILLLQQDFSQLVLQQTSKCLWRKCRGMPSQQTVASQSGHLLSNSLRWTPFSCLCFSEAFPNGSSQNVQRNLSAFLHFRM